MFCSKSYLTTHLLFSFVFISGCLAAGRKASPVEVGIRQAGSAFLAAKWWYSKKNHALGATYAAMAFYALASSLQHVLAETSAAGSHALELIRINQNPETIAGQLTYVIQTAVHLEGISESTNRQEHKEATSAAIACLEAFSRIDLSSRPKILALEMEVLSLGQQTLNLSK